MAAIIMCDSGGPLPIPLDTHSGATFDNQSVLFKQMLGENLAHSQVT